MTTIKEKQLIQKYHQDNGTKSTVISTEGWKIENRFGEKVTPDYYKVLTLDFYLYLLEQIPE